MLGNPFRAVSASLCNQQKYATNCNFRQVSSKHLITLTPKIYPFLSKSLSKILSANDLPGLLPMGQVRRQSYLPEGKIYLSQTTTWRLFRALVYAPAYVACAYACVASENQAITIIRFCTAWSVLSNESPQKLIGGL